MNRFPSCPQSPNNSTPNQMYNSGANPYLNCGSGGEGRSGNDMQATGYYQSQHYGQPPNGNSGHPPPSSGSFFQQNRGGAGVCSPPHMWPQNQFQNDPPTVTNFHGGFGGGYHPQYQNQVYQQSHPYPQLSNYQQPLDYNHNPDQPQQQYYNTFQHQNYFPRQANPYQVQLSNQRQTVQDHILHPHPYQRNSNTAPNQQRRPTGFLEQLLENRPIPRYNYPFGYRGTGSAPQGGLGCHPGYMQQQPQSDQSRFMPPPQQQSFQFVGRQGQSQQIARGNQIVMRTCTINQALAAYNENKQEAARGERLRELLRGNASDRFKKNTSLLETILDDKIVSCNPSVVTTQRLDTLKEQVNLLSGELEKHESEMKEEEEICEKKREEMIKSSESFNEKYKQLSQPISSEVFDGMVDKFYTEMKEKATTDDCECTKREESEGQHADQGNLQTELGAQVPEEDGEEGMRDFDDKDIQEIGVIKQKPPANEYAACGNLAEYSEHNFSEQSQYVDISPPESQQSGYYGGMANANGIQQGPTGQQSCGGFYNNEQINYEQQQVNLGFVGVSPQGNYSTGAYRMPSNNQSSYMSSDCEPKSYSPALYGTPAAATSFYGVPQQSGLQRAHRGENSLTINRQRPSEELRKFLIKLVKEKCHIDLAQQQGLPGGGGESDQSASRRSGLFCGGGIMEVNSTSIPSAGSASQFAPYEWLKGIPKGYSSASQKSENVMDQQQGNDLSKSDLQNENQFGNVNNSYQAVHKDADGDNSGAVESVDGVPEGNTVSSAGSSKLAEILGERPCLNSEHDIKAAELALESNGDSITLHAEVPHVASHEMADEASSE